MASIFREKSMQRVSSPEQLNDYIRVTNPGVWVTLAAVAVLLVGFIVWGVAGSLETKVTAVAISDSETSACYVREADIADISQGDVVRVGDKEYAVSEISAEPTAVDERFSPYALHLSGFTSGEWVYSITLDQTLPDGVYAASVITDSVSPISFLFN